MRIALVSQNYPPSNEAGIARWTWMVAKGLAERGNIVHVITRADGDEESTHYAEGYWIHKICTKSAAAGTVAELYDIPENIAAWAARVTRELSYLKTFGLQLVSFPIWDLEALPAIDDPDLTTVVSLHTTYKMAKPFKPEWNLRPIYEFNMVNRMIAAEGDLLKRAPNILANSQAIVSILQSEYGVDLGGRHEVVAHGTTDPLESNARSAAARERRRQMLDGDRLRVLYVGRFEPRKGFDIAAAVAEKLLQQGNIEVRFVGDRLDDDWKRRLRLAGCTELQESDRLRFLGVVDRPELDDAYVQADIVLTPSRFESFGLVAIEAMAAGRPVMALSAGGLGEVVTNGLDGLTWTDGKGVAEQICNAILTLERDRGRLDEMGKAARTSFEQKFTVERMVVGMEAFYRSSLDRSRRH